MLSDYCCTVVRNGRVIIGYYLLFSILDHYLSVPNWNNSKSTEGVLRVYYYTNTGEENIRYFDDENHLILDGPVTDANYIPSKYLHAVTDCKFVVFSKKD